MWDWVTRETLVDVTVNFVPLVILAYFVVLFTTVNPWELDPLLFVLSQGLLIVPFFFLLVVTTVAAYEISQTEIER